MRRIVSLWLPHFITEHPWQQTLGSREQSFAKVRRSQNRLELAGVNGPAHKLGLYGGQPHEILPKRSGWDDASVTAFTLAWLQRRQQTDQRLALWVMQRPSLYPPVAAHGSSVANEAILRHFTTSLILWG